MASYKKVFFYPWVGPDYEKGINFDHNGRLICKEPDGWKTYEKDGKKTPVALIHPELSPLRVAVYGKEHYCKDRAHCEHSILEQNFYLQMLTPATLGQLQNAANVEKYIDQLAQFHKDPFFTLAGIDWKDKFYVLHKDYNWPLCQIEKYFKLSSADLCLYMALEKILTFLSQWDKSSAQQANEVVKIVQNFQQFKNEAALHPACFMHLPCRVPNGEKYYDKKKPKCACCEQLPVCRYQTQRQLSGYSTEMEEESDSHRPFREALGNTPKIWKHLLFSNFYQRSKAKETGNFPTEIEQAVSAFAEVVRINKPDILITWGNEVRTSFLFPLLQKKNLSWVLDILKQEKLNLTLMQKSTKGYKFPRLTINHQQKVPFTTLKWTDGSKKKPCLILMFYHPSAKKYFNPQIVHEYIRCAFKHYDELIKWDPVKNQNTLGLSYPITCEFDTKLDWLNPQAQADFQKCI